MIGLVYLFSITKMESSMPNCVYCVCWGHTSIIIKRLTYFDLLLLTQWRGSFLRVMNGLLPFTLEMNYVSYTITNITSTYVCRDTSWYTNYCTKAIRYLLKKTQEGGGELKNTYDDKHSLINRQTFLVPFLQQLQQKKIHPCIVEVVRDESALALWCCCCCCKVLLSKV